MQGPIMQINLNFENEFGSTLKLTKELNNFNLAIERI